MQEMQNNQQQTKQSKTKISSNKDKFMWKCPLYLGETAIGIKILQLLEGTAFSIFISVITIITLFSDDIRIISFTQDSDIPFSILSVICMSIYAVEIVALCFLKEGYFLRYYFWLDLISTLTIIFDLSWIYETMASNKGVEDFQNIVVITKASQVTRIGTQSAKFIRILRVIRVLRLLKTATRHLNKENLKSFKIQQDLFEMKHNQNGVSDERLNKRQPSIKIEKGNPGFESIIDPVINEAYSKNSQKHQVSLRNITFQGSQRKLSALHPSQKFGSNQKVQGIENKYSNKNLSNPQISSKKQVTVKYKIKANQVANFVSDDHIYSQEIGKKKSNSNRNSSGESFDVSTETKVGTRLKQEIQKNIVTMILFMIISVPLLNVDSWFENVTSKTKSLVELQFFLQKGSSYFDAQQDLFIKQMITKNSPMVYFSVPINTTCCNFPLNYPEYINQVKLVSSLRTSDILVYSSQTKNITIAFDGSEDNILSAKLSIGRTLFVCAMLIAMNILFTRDIEKEALEPLQNMIDTVQKISENPLQAIKEIEKENFIKYSVKNQKNNLQLNQQQQLMLLKQQKRNQTEPVLLQNLIIKIGSLLAVGFGEAGTQLIAKNIESYGSLNVMMPGKKVMCIFGFCDIRNFTDATQILQAKVMVFVNQIAQICHNTVNKMGGNPNKNIGDAFLIVWKFKQSDVNVVKNGAKVSLQLQQSLKVKQTADLSVYSFVKMIAEIARSQNLQKYKQNKKLQERIKNYEGVKLGFGLHIGEAIEGPIGSQFKIDASYLGENVNISGRLEAATKGYGVPLLISGDLYNVMTIKNREYLRKVDKVQMRTGEKPMDLYTIDISVQNLIKTCGIKKKTELASFDKKKAKVFFHLSRDKLMSTIEKKRITAKIFSESRDLQAMRQPFSSSFFEDWKIGFEFYEQGDWQKAREIFKKTQLLGLNESDGPSKRLLKFMGENKNLPPINWSGCRIFEE